ncbi:50S ribosomal protein L35 [Patescibacteria group bacterium]|nr:50S ribosomal protein L35 [Patescibacteria group bacterium]
MTKRAITDRFRVTKNGKILRRPMGLGHSRANKNEGRIRHKRKNKILISTDSKKIAKKYLG